MSIGGISSSMMSSMFTQGTRSRPSEADMFKKLDTDGNGGLDKTELAAMSKDISKMTGKTVDLVGKMKTFDANNDGLLSQDETKSMMQQVMGPPPDMGSGVSMQQAVQSYQANSGDDQLSSLLKMLEQISGSSSSSSTSSSSASSGDDQFAVLMKMLSQGPGSSASSRTNPDEMFKKLDSDNSGGLNQSDLDVMAKDFSKMTGQTIDSAKSISTYDTNGDGELNQSEMDTMMKALHDKSGGSQTGSADTQQLSSDDKASLIKQLMEQYVKNLSSGNSMNVAEYI